MRTVKIIWLLLVIVGIQNGMKAQNASVASTYVDEKGILRWSLDDTEIHGFGVNYSVPFAHAYRMAERMGVDHKKAIRQDVYHFARLDLDLFRVHVWDTEISDSVGNLLENSHLDLFDFAISEMKKRDMNFIITPIAFWGNGWPEPDEDTPGFSNKYGKAACLTNPQAIKAQAKYLEQFLNHVNPYTGLAYKDDPDVIAFEVSNEPHHDGTKTSVMAYINRLVGAMRKTGTEKPIFYNMSHSTQLADAYLEADVQGGTFQWYPAGLVAGHALNGNFLPHVEQYPIPFAENPEFQNKAKIVYEFDPADVAGNYMYPAMARTFRKAGIQLATHFAYDAMFLAPYNTNYGTHYMSLPYAPQKAISLKIASAVFHDIPLESDYGSYPLNTSFGNFRIDYEKDLVELVDDTRFFYSNRTNSVPPQPQKLKEIAGFGSSSLVGYEGEGAYFLDKIEEKLWRLEVMPDAHWLGDPYAPVSPKRQVSAVRHGMHPMTLRLPGMPENFSVTAINENNGYSVVADAETFQIKPGVYLVGAENLSQIDVSQKYKNIILDEYVAPETNLDTLLIKNHTAPSCNEGEKVKVEFEVVSDQKPSQIMVYLATGWRGDQLMAEKTNSGSYQVSVPEKYIKHGTLNYYILIETKNGWQTFPSGVLGKPGDWDFISGESFQIDVLPADAPVLLWEAGKNWPETMSTWRNDVSIKPTFEDSKLYYAAEPDSLETDFGLPFHTFKYYFADDIKGRNGVLKDKTTLVVEAKAMNGSSSEIEIGLIDGSASVRSFRLIINGENDVFCVPLKDMEPAKFAIVPRPYPGFLPYYANINTDDSFELNDIEIIQVSLLNNGKPAYFTLDKIWIE